VLFAGQASGKSDAESQESDLVDNSDYEDYADDDDSVFSQSSSKTPRKKLQPNRMLIFVKHKSGCSPQ
jgi:hypothetical protein